MVGFVLFLALFSGLEASSWYDKYVEFWTEIVPNNETLLKLFNEQVAQSEADKQKRADYAVPLFTCDMYNPFAAPPTSVHELHPSDIGVVAAMGDSLTAGQALRSGSIFTILTQYRGEAWSIGGNGDYYQYLTLPNILKRYNPNLKGFSTGSGDENDAVSKLNVAVSGDEAQHMPGQATKLVQKINQMNVTNEWKLVTLFIGGNDLCSYCEDRELHTPMKYIDFIDQALTILQDNLTKTFVNLVTIFDIAPIAQIEGGLVCSFAHAYACNCGKQEDLRGELLKLTTQYQIETRMLIESGKFDTRDDFTVVVQPLFRDTVPPLSDPTNSAGNVDMSYFANDCFHFSAKGHAAAALSLWNNMIEPICDKKTEWHLNEPLYCPGQFEKNKQPFLSTYKNSQATPYSFC